MLDKQNVKEWLEEIAGDTLANVQETVTPNDVLYDLIESTALLTKVSLPIALRLAYELGKAAGAEEAYYKVAEDEAGEAL